MHISLVDLLLFVYNGSTQFAPAALFGVFRKRMSLLPVALGLAVGEIAAALLTQHPVYLYCVDPGFFAVALNTLVCVVSWTRFGGHDLKPGEVPGAGALHDHQASTA